MISTPIHEHLKKKKKKKSLAAWRIFKISGMRNRFFFFFWPYVSHLSSFLVKSFKSVQNVQSRQVKCGLQEQIWCSMFKVDRCSMYLGSLPLIFNGSVPGHENVYILKCMYISVNFHECSPSTLTCFTHSYSDYI